MVNATYRQTIYFVNGRKIDGYSKKIGFVEPVDPINCLTNFILRMYISEYLLKGSTRIDPVRHIDYCYNHTHSHILTCRYDFVELNPAIIETQPRLVQWIGQFYKDLDNKLAPEQMQAKYHRRGRAAYNSDLDINQNGYLNPDQLVRKVVQLIRDGLHPLPHIGHFYRQCMEKYFNSVSQQDIVYYNTIVNKMINRS